MFDLTIRLYETDESALEEHDKYFTVLVTVVPEQDGKPVWDVSSYDATISSDAPFGSYLPINPSWFDFSDPDGKLENDLENPHAVGTLSVFSCQCGNVSCLKCISFFVIQIFQIRQLSRPVLLCLTWKPGPSTSSPPSQATPLVA